MKRIAISFLKISLLSGLTDIFLHPICCFALSIWRKPGLVQIGSWKRETYFKWFTDNCWYSSMTQYQYIPSGSFSKISYNKRFDIVSMVFSYSVTLKSTGLLNSGRIFYLCMILISDSLKGLRHSIPQHWDQLLPKCFTFCILFLKCTQDFVLIQVWWGQQIGRQLSLKRQFVTYSSQEEGVHHAMRGLRKYQGQSGGRMSEGMCG